MEERREWVIRLSSDNTSFLQNRMVDYFGSIGVGKPMILAETGEMFRRQVRFFTKRAG